MNAVRFEVYPMPCGCCWAVTDLMKLYTSDDEGFARKVADRLNRENGYRKEKQNEQATEKSGRR